MTATRAPSPRRPLSDRLLAAFTADQWRKGLAVHAVLWGAGYAFGPAQWSSSPTFDVILKAHVPIRGWGAAGVLLGLALLVRRWSCTVHGIAAVLWLVWTIGLLLALPYGSLVAWGSWLHTGVVSAVHRHLSGAGRTPARR